MSQTYTAYTTSRTATPTAAEPKKATPHGVLSLKTTIEAWQEALELYDAKNYDKAVEAFLPLVDAIGSKIYFNIAVIFAMLGEHDDAIRNFESAIKLDQYFALAYHLKGVSHFVLGDYNDAMVDFNDALKYLRGNLCIQYTQLGLDYKLYSCEVLYNRGIASFRAGEYKDGIRDLEFASKEKKNDSHSVIDRALREKGRNHTVFCLPVGLLFRPPQSKVKNIKEKNYLGESKVLTCSETFDNFTGFTGLELKSAFDKKVIEVDSNEEEWDHDLKSFAALNLVKKDYTSPKGSPKPAYSKEEPNRSRSRYGHSRTDSSELSDNSGRSYDKGDDSMQSSRRDTPDSSRPPSRDRLDSPLPRTPDEDSVLKGLQKALAAKTNFRKENKTDLNRNGSSTSTSSNSSTKYSDKNLLRSDSGSKWQMYSPSQQPAPERPLRPLFYTPDSVVPLRSQSARDTNRYRIYRKERNGGSNLGQRRGQESSLDIIADYANFSSGQSSPATPRGNPLTEAVKSFKGMQLNQQNSKSKADEPAKYSNNEFNGKENDGNTLIDRYAIRRKPSVKSPLHRSKSSSSVTTLNRQRSMRTGVPIYADDQELTESDVQWIRIKSHFTSTKTILIPSIITYNDFLERLRNKYKMSKLPRVLRRDDDGEMIHIADEEDFEVAIVEANFKAVKDDDGLSKLEIWLEKS